MHILNKKKIIIAMSGGVDSSAAAWILKEQGYDVTGMMLKIWDDLSKCCSLADIADARDVAMNLNIPFYLKKFQPLFEKEIVTPFVESYLRGETPLPCATCNSKIKFPLIIEEGKKLGSDLLATGHYAKIKKLNDGSYSLFKGDDPNKDQTYFLFQLKQTELRHIIFPVGDMNKAEVRKIAENVGVNMAQKKESQEVCFVNDDYKGFVESRVPFNMLKKGNIVTKEGVILGKHLGIHRYTIGQRKGLGVSWKYPLYVIAIDAKNNNIIVGKNDDLYSNIVEANAVTWLNKVPQVDEIVTAKVRYRQIAEKAKVLSIDDHHIRLEFEDNQRAVTRGQGLVLYRDDSELLGGGIII